MPVGMAVTRSMDAKKLAILGHARRGCAFRGGVEVPNQQVVVMLREWMRRRSAERCGGANRAVVVAAVVAVVAGAQEGKAQAGWRWVQANAVTSATLPAHLAKMTAAYSPTNDTIYVAVHSYSWAQPGGSWQRSREGWSFNCANPSWPLAPSISHEARSMNTGGPYPPFVYSHLGSLVFNPNSQAVDNIWMDWQGSNWTLANTPFATPLSTTLHGAMPGDFHGTFYVAYSTGISKHVIVAPHGVTSEWDGVNPLQTIQPLVVPPTTSTNFMIHDSIRDRIVYVSPSTNAAALWEYDIAQRMWHERINMIPPAFTRRDNFTLGYHPPTGNVVIYGGRDTNGTILGDVWHYDGTSFYQAIVGASPARRENAFMVYRSATQEMLMWGGSNGAQLRDTWAYTPGTATVAYNYYGAGCPGAAGTPYLDLTPNSSTSGDGIVRCLPLREIPFFLVPRESCLPRLPFSCSR